MILLNNGEVHDNIIYCHKEFDYYFAVFMKIFYSFEEMVKCNHCQTIKKINSVYVILRNFPVYLEKTLILEFNKSAVNCAKCSRNIEVKFNIKNYSTVYLQN